MQGPPRVRGEALGRLLHRDVVGRVGGDQFVALCDGADASALADRLRAAVAAPVQVGHDSVCVTASIGVAIAKEATAADTEAVARALLVQADEAMYAAKRARRPGDGTHAVA